MLAIKSFTQLATEEEQALCDYYKNFGDGTLFTNPAEMGKALESPQFENGNEYFILWDGNRIRGTLGCISKGIPDTGAAYITGMACSSTDAQPFVLLLRSVLKHVDTFAPSTIRIGVPEPLSFLAPYLAAENLEETDRTLVLVHQPTGAAALNTSSITLQPLSPENKTRFLLVQNEAFREVPNATALTEIDLERLLGKVGRNNFRAGVAVHADKPMGIYELAIKSDTGWIESMGVHPGHQHKGIGTLLLHALMNNLYRECDRIAATVTKSNASAMKMFTRNGFAESSVQTVWYERKRQL